MIIALISVKIVIQVIAWVQKVFFVLFRGGTMCDLVLRGKNNLCMQVSEILNLISMLSCHLGNHIFHEPITTVVLFEEPMNKLAKTNSVII